MWGGGGGGGGWGMGGGGGAAPPPPPRPPPRELGGPDTHYAQESLPHDDTIPDPAVAIKKRPNTRTYPGVFTFSSNGTAAGRPPHQSKILEGKRKGVSRVAVFGRERGAVGVLSPSPERFPFPSPIQLSHSVSIASRGASAAPPRHDTTYTRQNPQAPASWLR